MSTEIDKPEDELKAIRVLCTWLDRFGTAACRRILNYLWDRYVPTETPEDL